MSTEVATKKLAELIAKLDEGSVHKIKHKGGIQRISVLGDKGLVSPLPTLEGIHNNTRMNLDLCPYPEGGYMANIEVHEECPFKLVLSLENTEVKSLKFKTARSIPVAEITIGDEDFDKRYLIETLEEDVVTKFLSKKEVRDLISKLGDFDRFTFQSKHMRLVYYVEDLEKLDSEWLFKMIEILVELAKKLKP